MYITAPPVNYSILCLSSIVHIVAFVNLLLKKMVVVVHCTSSSAFQTRKQRRWAVADRCTSMQASVR